ncbi:hypothetical protein LUU34_01481400 [Aix galericulata]|nr:hypothetical protein LUU34_01481400 [Aix galericulata]
MMGGGGGRAPKGVGKGGLGGCQRGRGDINGEGKGALRAATPRQGCQHPSGVPRATQGCWSLGCQDPSRGGPRLHPGVLGSPPDPCRTSSPSGDRAGGGRMGTLAPRFTVTALGSILMVLGGGLKGVWGGVGAPRGPPTGCPQSVPGGVIGGRWELGCSEGFIWGGRWELGCWGGCRPPFPARG